MMLLFLNLSSMLLLSLGVYAQDVPSARTENGGSTQVYNITRSAGEDILISWEHKDPTWINWNKDDVAVGATDAAREGRLFVLPEKGLLILNSEWEDRGWYTCVVVDSQHIVHERVYWVDVAPAVDIDLDTTGFPCGYPRVRGKIVGGKIAEHGQSPWTVLLWDKQKNKPFCGGALLNRRWIITSAHCFALSEFNDSNKELFEIRLGEYDTVEDDGSEIHLRAETIIINPYYDQQNYDSDIALIKLRQPITYTDYILPICLPSDMRAQELVTAGKSGFVTGWGNTQEEGHYSRYLRRVKLNVVNQQTCGSMHTHIITNNMFCASSSNRAKDACQGDSGGPFAIKDSQRWYLVGLVSWGIGCANPQYPGVYTRVQRFKQWIEDLIEEDMQTCEESQFQLLENLQQKKSKIHLLESRVEDQLSEISGLKIQVQEKDGLLETALEQTCSTQQPKTDAITTTQILSTTTPKVATTIPTTSPVTFPPPSLPPVQRVSCHGGSCWHVGGHRVYATCENGFCVCDSPNYARETCLPSVDSCQIHQHSTPSAAHASYLGVAKDTYKCVTQEPGRQSIHVLSVYEGSSHTRPPTAGDMRVILETSSPSNKPVVLVLVSYEPVRWILDVPRVVVIDEIVMVSYYIAESSVTWAEESRDVPTTASRTIPRGYGSDAGGGNTVGLLQHIRNRYGPVNTFTGTYRADSWTLDVSYGNTPHHDHGGETPHTSTEISRDEWTPFTFRYDDNWNACDGQQFVRMTGYDIGSYVGVILCSPTRYKIFLSDNLQDTFRNIADSSGHGQDHCELVGAAEDTPQTIDSNFWVSPASTGYYRSDWGDVFTMGSIGGGLGDNWTGKYYIQWYECGVSIP